ncbi:MAG TPA: histidine phosphatase family protein [Actinophytocola sp.]|uniref:histidine phosphatase family protein n=1 Tax=Actinophytocola sp. TaxID=1872138 RepID=UPI002DDCEEE4|nr:histidine phosphatase family protein [Actinophytocola sp.]HEV2782422.1 histidine phosphatase family protein [Actinophytocola sp.]
MPTVYLIRHGQASFGAADYDVLSEVGEQQSKVLGEELRRREVRVDRVWSGTLRRHRATAAACLPVAEVDLPIDEDPRWNEYDHLTLVQRSLPPEEIPSGGGGKAQDFQRLLDAALLAWMGEPETSWPDFQDGACAALDEVFVHLGKGGAGLVFTSGGVISAICARLLDLRPDGFLALNRTMVNASLTKLVHGRSGTSLISLNEHGHFEGPHRELLSYR